MDAIWKLVCEGNHDALLRFVPDNVLDSVAAMRPSSESASPLSFRDIVQYGFAVRGFTFDSYAERHLFHSPPAPSGSPPSPPPGTPTTHGSVGPLAGPHVGGSLMGSRVTRLSCMRTAPDRAVLRYLVAAEGGERAVLTFGLQCDEMLSPHYRSARIEYIWQLASVTGEAATRCLGGEAEGAGLEPGEHATRPHPSLPPEAVVEAQLAALMAEDAETVFAFASPANQALTGPLERFDELLRSPVYRPLLRHRAATPYRRATTAPESYSEVLRVVSDNTGMPQGIEAIYTWELQRQGPDAGPLAGCWLTNSVRLVEARPLAS